MPHHVNVIIGKDLMSITPEPISLMSMLPWLPRRHPALRK